MAYTVQSGDSLSKIANKHKVSIEDILHANPQILNPDRIGVGQTINIPGNSYYDIATGYLNDAQKFISGSTDEIIAILRKGSAMIYGKVFLPYKMALDKACALLNCKSFDRKRFFNAYRKEFGAIKHKSYVTGLNTLLKFIERDNEINNIRVMAYMLATIHHESYNFLTGERYVPLTEVGQKSYFDMYDPVLAKSARHKKRAIKHENTKKGDGYKYRGRGYVQITWKINYRKMGDVFGVDLVNKPDLALNEELSYKIASYGMRKGTFTGKKIGDYITTTKADYVNARRVINKLDEAHKIAKYAEKFERVLAQSIVK